MVDTLIIKKKIIVEEEKKQKWFLKFYGTKVETDILNYVGR